MILNLVMKYVFIYLSLLLTLAWTKVARLAQLSDHALLVPFYSRASRHVIYQL